jgi:hypothetical protein
MHGPVGSGYQKVIYRCPGKPRGFRIRLRPRLVPLCRITGIYPLLQDTSGISLPDIYLLNSSLGILRG